MSRINDLIAELAPNGVPYLPLNEVVDDFIVPMRDRPKVFDGDIPWCRIEDVEGLEIHGSKTGLAVSKSVVDEMNLKIMPEGAVIASCSASLGTYAIATQPLITNQTFIGLVCSDRLFNRFLLYVLFTKTKELRQASTTGTISYVSRTKFEQLVIPVPPLSIQKEIVGILDTFTKLEAELEAELVARTQQYEYYRGQLLSDSSSQDQELTLGEIFDMRAGSHIKASEIHEIQSSTHPYPCFGGNGIRGYVSSPSHNGDLVFIGRQGALCGNVQRSSGEIYATEHAVVVTPKSDVDMNWAFHKLTAMDLNQYKTKSAQPGLAVGRLKNLTVNLPPPNEQQRIAEILDKFHALVNDLSVGLPAEITARRQQYEYYRDKLLTFRETE